MTSASRPIQRERRQGYQPLRLQVHAGIDPYPLIVVINPNDSLPAQVMIPMPQRDPEFFFIESSQRLLP